MVPCTVLDEPLVECIATRLAQATVLQPMLVGGATPPATSGREALRRWRMKKQMAPKIPSLNHKVLDHLVERLATIRVSP